MEIIINHFTKFCFEKVKEETISKTYKMKIENLYFKYSNENIVWEKEEVQYTLLNIERLLKNKLEEPKKIDVKEEEISLILYPRAYGDKKIIDIQIFLKNDEGKNISEYILTLEKEDIITLYVYLCKILNRQNQLNKPKDDKYMFLFVRYLDIDSVKQFCYLSDDETIRVGDYVLVDRAGNLSIAIVEKIEFYKKEDSPFPFEKTKEIIRKVEREELKQDTDESQKEDTQESYITIGEFNELKKGFNALKDMVKNVNHKLHIKELMKQIARDNIFLEVYYNKELNIFIEKVNDIYFISKYRINLFTKKEWKEILKNSISIEPKQTNNLSVIYDLAIEICKKETIEYIDNFENIKEIFDFSNLKLQKIIDTNTNREQEIDFFYKYICEKTYRNIKVYVRDMDLTNEEIRWYRNNIGEMMTEKEYVECTKKIGGFVKNTRTYIIGNAIKDLSLFEQETNYGLCVADKNSNFKILEVGNIENKNYIILLQMDKDTGDLLRHVSTNIDSKVKDICREQMQKDSKKDPVEELDKSWYDRIAFPIGINRLAK